MKKERTIYFDYLRVFAILSVIMLHVASENWGNLNVRELEWNIRNIYDSCVRWGVPVFVMISGALFLDREIPTKTIYTKYVSRMAIAYCVWSVFYAVGNPTLKYLITSENEFSIRKMISNMIVGEYHMWFIPMIIGIYICIPLVQLITKHSEKTKYFLILSFIFSFFIPQIKNISNDYIGGTFNLFILRFNDVISNMSVKIVVGYIFYFVLGYTINKLVLTKKAKRIIYILGILGFVSTILLNAGVAWITQRPCSTYFSNFSINVLFEALAVFTFFKECKLKNIRLNNIVIQLSKYSFGAYLIHVFVLCTFELMKFDSTSFNTALSIPVITLFVAVISFFISFVIHKIPILNRWIV